MTDDDEDHLPIHMRGRQLRSDFFDAMDQSARNAQQVNESCRVTTESRIGAGVVVIVNGRRLSLEAAARLHRELGALLAEVLP